MLFGDYIKQLRESRQIPMSTAARRLGIPAQKLWDIENGRRYQTKVPEKFLESLAKVYKVPIGVIVESASIRQVSSKPHSEQLAAMLPIIDTARRECTVLVNESRAYTPELESSAIKLFELLSRLKIQLETAYRQLYPNTQTEIKNEDNS